MPVLARLQIRARQPLAVVTSSRASRPEWVSASSSELPQRPSLKGGVSCSDKAFVGCLSTLALENERLTKGGTCRADCLSCLALIRENTMGRRYFAIDFKPNEVHW